jgi:hypothetical protein
MKQLASTLLVPALILAGCNSGTVNAQQSNETSANATATASAAPAAGAPSARDGVCSFSGWSSDLDPRGLNVRAGPSATARIVGTLPPPEDHPDNETRFGATFDVVESRDGWFRIENARRWSQEGRGPSNLPSGWISGRYLGFHLQTDKAFAEPDPASPVVAISWEEDGGIMPFAYRQPSDCRGEWVRLTVAGRDGRARQGWARGVCGIQETSCDGVPGDLVTDDPSRGWRGMD